MELIDLETARILGEALAIGVLLGAERYRGRSPGEESFAGVRTFATIGLLGGVCALVDHVAFTAVTFAAVALLVVIGYQRASVEHLGATTETAALLTFWVGYMVRDHEAAAIGTGIVLAILLAAKRPMHDFVGDKISNVEFFDTLKFLAVVFVAYPLLPDTEIGPYEFFNPRQAWSFVILFSAISYAGYFLVKMIGSGRGLFASAILGGLVSTPAVTVSLADRANHRPEHARLISAAAVAGNAMQLPRLLLLMLVLDRSLAWGLAPFLLSMFAVGLLGAWIVGSLGRDDADDGLEMTLRNPFSFLPALRFALYLVAFLFLSRLALAYFGARGVYLVATLTGLATVSAVAVSLPGLVSAASLPASSAALVLLLAIGANAAVKVLLALMNGPRAMALWLAGGLATILATGAACWLAMRTMGVG